MRQTNPIFSQNGSQPSNPIPSPVELQPEELDNDTIHENRESRKRVRIAIQFFPSTNVFYTL
jgi:hypothetical protein